MFSFAKRNLVYAYQYTTLADKEVSGNIEAKSSRISGFSIIRVHLSPLAQRLL